jgi:hypothetical protein
VRDDRLAGHVSTELRPTMQVWPGVLGARSDAPRGA